MNCASFDPRDYFFGELAGPDRASMEQHVEGCPACRAELVRLSQTRDALLALREEEIPQRVAFVSDRVYEPSAWKRAWRAFWHSGPRLGFASAAMVSAALVFATLRPVPPVPAAPAVDTAALRAEMTREVRAAVTRATAEAEARHRTETARLLAAAEERFTRQREQDAFVVATEMALLKRQMTAVYRASFDAREPQP